MATFTIRVGAVLLATLALPALAADLPDSFNYPTELKLRIATAISPRSPPVRMHRDPERWRQAVFIRHH